MRRSGFYAFIFLILGHPSEGFAQARRILTGEKRSLSDSLIRKTVEGDDAFRYDSGPLLQAPGWWERFWNWVWSLFRAGTSGPVAGRIWEYIFLALAVGFIVFAVMKLLGMDMAYFFRKKAKSVDLAYEELSNNIHEISFTERIEECISQRQYRLAVRLLYLQTLKDLSDRQIIHWKKEKTNAEYLREINAELQTPFGQLTREFEYVWYGEFPIDEPAFFTIQNNFSDFGRGLEGRR